MFEFLRKFKNRPNINNKAKLFLWLAIIFYIIIFIIVAFKKYYYFSYNVSDLAIFNQTFFNTLHGRWFQETIIGENLFAAHFSPIIFLLLPFYFLAPSPLTLLILQTIGLALAAWPLFCLTKLISKREDTALLVSVAWLLNPLVHWANLDENHLLYLVPFFVFWAAYFYWQNKFYKFLLFFVLALLVREDIPLLMLGWGFIAWLDHKGKKWVIGSTILAVTYFFLSLAIIKFFAGGSDYKFFIFYGWLGGHDLFSIIWGWLSHPLAVFRHLFTWENISGLFFIFLVLLFIPLLRPKYLLLSILPFFQLAMNITGFGYVAFSNRFALLFLPGTFLAFIFSLEHIKQRKKFFGSKFIYDNFAFSKFILIFTLLYFAVFLSPTTHIIAKKYNQQQRDQREAIIKAIPDEASVETTNNFLPRLSSRQFIYSIDYAYFGHVQFGREDFSLPLVDYLLVDYSDFLGSISDAQNNPFYKEYWPQMPGKWRDFLQNYVLVRAENNLLLWQKKNNAVSAGLKIYEWQDKKTKLENNSFLFTRESAMFQGQLAFKLSVQNIGDPINNYLVRFYHGADYFDVPLDYGLMSANDWLDKTASFYYYLSPQVDSFQIFSWQGINKLGLDQDIYLDKKIKAITDRTFFINN